MFLLFTRIFGFTLGAVLAYLVMKGLDPTFSLTALMAHYGR